MPAVVFLHAHPDDEAIFTGGTMRLLADRGVDCHLVVATGGELGLPVGADPLDDVRRAETDAAATMLGLAGVHHLGYRDSGIAGDRANDHPASFWQAPVAEAADRLVQVLAAIGASGADPVALVSYDPRGIYGHPDHVQAHRVGRVASAAARVGSWYEVTVDREHLHFVETHLVEEALLAGDLGLARSNLGTPTVEVTTTVDVRSVLDVKRAAMAAHASQIPTDASPWQLTGERFAAVYGWEWYVRSGPPGPLDQLT